MGFVLNTHFLIDIVSHIECNSYGLLGNDAI